MFSAGTRVYVHSSSLHGKKLGPKQHSIGYIISVATKYIVKDIKNFPMNQQFLITPVKIVFTRYGREKRRRIEIRSFMNITPISLNTNGEFSVDTVNKILSIFNEGELYRNSNWSTAIRDTSTKAIGVLLPADGHSKSCLIESTEGLAFIMAMLHNKKFNYLINNNKNLHTLKQLAKDKDIILWIGNAAKQNKIRINLFNWAKETRSNMVNLLYHIQIFRTAFNRRTVETSIKNISAMVNGGKTVGFNKFIEWYTDSIFESTQLVDRKKSIISSKAFGNTALPLANNIDIVRDTYLSHKPKYI